MERIEKIEKEAQIQPPKQPEQIEGFIGDYDKNWRQRLPVGIKPEMVELNLERDGWHWHLRPEFIKDEEEKQKYLAEKKTMGRRGRRMRQT